MPKVSIIIPTYNRAQFLYDAITSVLNQTYQDFEILVIDDCSQDNTQEIVNSFHDTRIKYIRHEKNKGEAGSRNTGIRSSSAEYIAFLDDDDEWLPEKLKLQVNLLENSQSKVGCIYTGYWVVDKTKEKILDKRIPQKRGYIHYDLFIQNHIRIPSTVILKRECFEKVSLFDETLTFRTDYDMWIRLSKEFNFDYIKEPLVKYRYHESRLSNNIAAVIAGMETLFKRYEQFFSLNKGGYCKYLMHLGILYCYVGNIKKSREALLKAIRLSPFQLRTYVNLGLSLLGASKFTLLRELRIKVYNKLRSGYMSGLKAVKYFFNLSNNAY